MIMYRPRGLEKKDGKGRDTSPQMSFSKRSVSSQNRNSLSEKPESGTGQVDGKTPIEASLMVMKMISEAAGTSNSAVGYSSSDRLRSLRTEPALKLLGTTTWREFFNKETEPAKNKLKMGNAGGIDTSDEDQQQFLMKNLSRVFSVMVERVETLWAVLKIPQSDIQFYSETLLKGPPESMQHCRAVAKYIQILQTHKAKVAAVMLAIQEREQLVSNFYDLLVALNRKMNNRRSMDSLHSQQQLDSNFWKEEFVALLRDVQTSTLKVVRAIQAWRKGLWRPQQFVYRNADYMEKIKEDMCVLDAPAHRRYLDSIPLRDEDLTCIMFQNGASASGGTAASYSLPNRANNGRPGSALPALRSSISASQLDPASSSPSSPGIVTQASLREFFLSGCNRQELAAAARMIADDAMLQIAIRAERKTLLDKGVFIPTLKMDFATTNAQYADFDD